MYSLRLSMYVMLMSRSLKKAERETYYITAIQHTYYMSHYLKTEALHMYSKRFVTLPRTLEFLRSHVQNNPGIL